MSEFFNKQHFTDLGFSRGDARRAARDSYKDYVQEQRQTAGLTSVFNQPQNSFMNPSMMNPYMMPQQPANPMQGILDMMMQLMPLVAMGVLPKETLTDMFSGMLGKSKTEGTSGEKLGTKDAEGWREVLTKKTASDDDSEEAGDVETNDSTKTFKNVNTGETRTVTVNPETDDITTVIKDKTGKVISTEIRAENGKAIKITKKQKFSVYDTDKSTSIGDKKYTNIEKSYSEETKLLQTIILTDKAGATATYTKSPAAADKGKNIFVGQDKKKYKYDSTQNRLTEIK